MKKKYTKPRVKSMMLNQGISFLCGSTEFTPQEDTPNEDGVAAAKQNIYKGSSLWDD